MDFFSGEMSSSLSIVHIHRIAAEVLLTACLESVIMYLSDVADSNSIFKSKFYYIPKI